MVSSVLPAYSAETAEPPHIHPRQTPRIGAATISIVLEPIRQFYLNIRQYY